MRKLQPKQEKFHAHEDAQHHMKWYQVAVGFIEVNDANGEPLDEGTLKYRISLFLAESYLVGQIKQAKDIKVRLQRLGLYDNAIQIIRESSLDYTISIIEKLTTT